jgi:hypothetical protein
LQPNVLILISACDLRKGIKIVEDIKEKDWKIYEIVKDEEDYWDGFYYKKLYCPTRINK